MNKKKILAAIAAMCVLSSSAAFAEYDPDKVIDPTDPIMTLSAEDEGFIAPTINGAILPSVEAKEVNGIEMIPVRMVAEGLGYTVEWHNESRSVSLTKGANYITFAIDKNEYAFSRRAPESLDAAPTLIDSVTYVPINFVSEIIGGYSELNEDGTYKIVNPSIVTVKEITEDGSILVEDNYLGDVLVHIGENTIITANGDLASVSDIEAGMVLGVEYDVAMTLSIPAQTTAVKIIIENLPVSDEVQSLSFSGVITEINEDLVTIGEGADGLRLVISEDTVITKGLDRRIYKIDDLAVGMTISGTHAEAATMSLPAQTVALTVNIESELAE